MVNNAPLLVLTAAQVDGWREQVREIEAVIEKHQTELALLHDRLKAVDLLVTDSSGQVFAVEMKTTAKATDPKDLTAAIEAVANDSPSPVPKRVLKQRLRDRGFAEDRLANYFYTAIMRLKAR